MVRASSGQGSRWNRTAPTPPAVCMVRNGFILTPSVRRPKATTYTKHDNSLSTFEQGRQERTASRGTLGGVQETRGAGSEER